jgi:glutathione peroxidase
MSTTIYDIPAKRIDGTPSSLGEFAGKVVLVVNVASACGFTPQYDALEKLYEAHHDAGFVVAAFPANDFGAQEPGTNEEIVAFCSTKFAVKFPMFEKIVVTGSDKHPIYQALTAAKPDAEGDPEALRQNLIGYGLKPTQAPEVLWNFEKFLIGRDGTVVGRYASSVTPDDPILVAAIEKELAKSPSASAAV